METGPVAAINTLSVSERNEGTRTMLGHLLPALHAVAPQIRQLLVCSRANRHLFPGDVEVLEVELDHADVLRRIAMDQWTVPRLVRGRADVLVNAGGVGSLLTQMPQVSIVSHQFALPSNRDAAGKDGPSRSRHVYYGTPLKRSMRRASAVVAVSEYLARGLVEELGADPAQVVAMPLGVEPPPRPPVLEARDPEVLFVSTLHAYKDAATAIEAFGLARPDLPPAARLVLVGKDPDGTQMRRLQDVAWRAGVADDVVLTGAIDASALERHYERAAALVMPSRYEGFGLPVAEAMSRGTPAIVADATSLPEVVGEAGIVVPVGDRRGFAAAMIRLLGDEQLRLRLARASVDRAATFTWPRAAAILGEAILRAATAGAAGGRRST